MTVGHVSFYFLLYLTILFLWFLFSFKSGYLTFRAFVQGCLLRHNVSATVLVFFLMRGLAADVELAAILLLVPIMIFHHFEARELESKLT